MPADCEPRYNPCGYCDDCRIDRSYELEAEVDTLTERVALLEGHLARMAAGHPDAPNGPAGLIALAVILGANDPVAVTHDTLEHHGTLLITEENTRIVLDHMRELIAGGL